MQTENWGGWWTHDSSTGMSSFDGDANECGYRGYQPVGIVMMEV